MSGTSKKIKLQEEQKMTIDWVSFTIGLIVMIIIWFVVNIINKKRFKAKYTLPELKQMIKVANGHLTCANKYLIELNKVFKEIEKTNE